MRRWLKESTENLRPSSGQVENGSEQVCVSGMWPEGWSSIGKVFCKTCIIKYFLNTKRHYTDKLNILYFYIFT